MTFCKETFKEYLSDYNLSKKEEDTLKYFVNQFHSDNLEVKESHSKENDGIGSYDCHGYMGYDYGTDYYEGDVSFSFIVTDEITESNIMNFINYLNDFELLEDLKNEYCVGSDIETEGFGWLLQDNILTIYFEY